MYYLCILVYITFFVISQLFFISYIYRCGLIYFVQIWTQSNNVYDRNEIKWQMKKLIIVFF